MMLLVLAVLRKIIPMALVVVCVSTVDLQESGPRLTSPPISEVAILDSLATFTCKGIGDGLVWTVAHTTLNDTVKKRKNIDIETRNINRNLSSNLTIPAVPINDKIEIGCVVVTVNPLMVVAEEAILTVDGVSQVENIKWFSESELLTWSPPLFYSKDTDAAFVYVIVLNGNETFNTTSTSKHLEISNCSQFNLSITVHADPYVSQNNDKISYGNHSVDIINHTMVFDQINNVVNISIINLVKFSDEVCSEPVHIHGNAIHIKDKHLFVYPPLEIASRDREEIVVNYNMTQLQPYNLYKVKVYLVNSVNMTEDQDDITISTFNVQDFSLNVTQESKSNRSVIVACMYIQGSITKSCHLNFVDNARDLQESFNITGASKQTLLSLKESGNYTVTVYDLVNGSVIGPAITYSKNIEIMPSSIISDNHSASTTIIEPTNRSTPSNKKLIYETVIPTTIILVVASLTILASIIIVVKRKKKGNNYQYIMLPKEEYEPQTLPS